MKNLAETNNIQYVITFFVMLLTLLGCEDSSSSIALGTLERERIAHTATANEVVVALPIAQGARVNLGDVLVQLDS
jgi:HlyD family secretion protein